MNENEDVKFRIVIKLRDSVLSRHDDSKKRSAAILNEVITLQSLTKAVCGKPIEKLFTTVSDEKIIRLVNNAKKSDLGYSPPSFLSYHYLNCKDESEARDILSALNKIDALELSYVESYFSAPPSVNAAANPLSSYQEYLNPAPVGINARYAWNFSGGDGSGGVRFIDIEQGWFLDHEDLAVRELPVTGLNHSAYEDHGAAVLGVIAMQDNTTGGVGITPNTRGHVISQWRRDGSFNTADAIVAALEHLRFGDILLLEAQTFDAFDTEQMWPLEILDANFQAIRLATALGVIVVEPAGNALYLDGNDLDSFIALNGELVLNRSNKYFRDSGAIVVAAASSDVPHTRINYSNYGSRIDCYAWGENVATAGLFPRSSGCCADTYSFEFGGTSGASAIIAGAAIAVQSITEAKYSARISPAQMRSVLSSRLYGTISENGHRVDKIGVMPDLRKIINRALNVAPLSNKKEEQASQKMSNAKNRKMLK